MKPNFKNIDIYAGFQPQNGMKWQKENGITADWKTPEHINVKPVYTKEDFGRHGALELCSRYSSLSSRPVP